MIFLWLWWPRISGDGWSLSFPDMSYSWGKPRKKPQPGKLTRPGIEPGPARWEATMLPLDQSGGQKYDASSSFIMYLSPFSCNFISLSHNFLIISSNFKYFGAITPISNSYNLQLKACITTAWNYAPFFQISLVSVAQSFHPSKVDLLGPEIWFADLFVIIKNDGI